MNNAEIQERIFTYEKQEELRGRIVSTFHQVAVAAAELNQISEEIGNMAVLVRESGYLSLLRDSLANKSRALKNQAKEEEERYSDRNGVLNFVTPPRKK